VSVFYRFIGLASVLPSHVLANFSAVRILSHMSRRTATPRWDVDGDDEENNNPNVLPAVSRDCSDIKVLRCACDRIRSGVLRISFLPFMLAFLTGAKRKDIRAARG
jgi:hypothetical protein